jgi:hypothetical protein
MMEKHWILVFFLLGPPFVGALRSADSGTWDKYNNLKDNGDLYVGEGVAKTSEFGGDMGKANQAARERAREDLASSVRVEVRSSVREEASQKDGQSSESLKSSGQSESAVVLENVKFRDFRDFPHDGDDTVLAYLSKEDYRRQLAGKAVNVYRPQFGVGITGSIVNLSSLASLQNLDIAQDAHSVNGGVGASMSMHAPQLSALGVELSWPFLVAEVSYATGGTNLYADNGDSTSGNPENFQTQAYTYSLWEAKVGYDITPWAWRYQPYVPLRLVAGSMVMGDGNGGRDTSTLLLGASAGLGFRYWFTDALALELSANWQQGFDSAAAVFPGNHPVKITPSVDANALDLTGLDLKAGLRWSGF